ncbi:MAG: hypothetical protein HOP12_01210 [Candidatus Eisenbacteria bacterium]|uniref:LPS-assembly protein LptD n=1 Tax=Eiseniibacteriota bacterium TaxID=2212470 RepID=A0A849SLI3_UNCEI|nr:hypothetical protein [Candidatus Eisenbacteria bacterium]
MKRITVFVWPVVLAALAAFAASCAPRVLSRPPGAALGDSVAMLRDPIAALNDSLMRARGGVESAADSGAVSDSARAALTADSLVRAGAAIHVETRSALEARKRRAPDPPLNIAASNVTGSHGPEGDIVMLNGNVRITRGRTVITADRGRYEREAGMLYLDDRVRLVDSTTVATCDHASYNEGQDLLWLTGNVVFRDRGATLRAPSGTFDRRAGRAELMQQVIAEDSTQTVTADHLTYWRDLQLLQTRGHVVAIDREHNVTMRADSVDYDRVSKDAIATGSPSLEALDEDGEGTTVLSALRLKVNSENRIAMALDSVRVVRDTLQARADSAVFDDRAGRAWLFGHPRAWDTETTVTGDTLEMWSEGRELRRFVVRRNAVMDYVGNRPDSRGETSRLTGDRVDVFVDEDRIDSLLALGSARSVYTSRAREGKTPEQNQALGDTILVYFKDRKVERALVLGHASGEYRFGVAEDDTAAARREFVRYESPRIEFFVPRDLIVLGPRASLEYRDLALSAQRVEFDSQAQSLKASGTPELLDRGDRVTGRLMTYDLETEAGTIYDARTNYEKGIYRGDQIRKVGENVLNVKHGVYTTCDLEHPHYHFAARYMKIQLKDKLVARPVVFFIKNVPLLALPFYVFPTKPGRHSGLLLPQVEFGFSSQGGQFVRNAGYYYAPNDYMDFTVSGDYYRADPSFVLRAESFYKLQYVLNGYFTGSFRRDDRVSSQDYSFSGDHSQELSPRTRLLAGANFVSSRDYQRDPQYGTNLGNRLNRFLTSKLYLTHNADWASFTALVDRRQDLDADESIRFRDGFGGLTPPAIGTLAALPNLLESAPQMSVSFPTRSLGSISAIKNSPFAKPLGTMYLSLSATVQRQHERRAVVAGYAPFNPDPVTIDSTALLTQRDSTRSGGVTQFSITDSRRLFGWLNVAPRFSATGALFDRDVLGNRWVGTGTWNSGISTSSTFYGTFRSSIGRLVGLRHVVFPSVSYGYSPDFEQLTYIDANGVRRQRFSSFGSIGVSGFRNSSLSFNVDQRLQAKWKRGDDVLRLDNLLSWSTSGSYNFLFREQGQLRGLSDLGTVLRLQPPGLVSADVSSRVDPYSQRPLRTLGFNLNANFSGSLLGSGDATQTPYTSTFDNSPDAFSQPWSLALSYSYSGGYAGLGQWSSTRYMNGVASSNLSKWWRAEYLATYDFNSRSLLSQRFGLTRDLHCWFATFSRSFVIGGEAEYYFKIGLKDLREIFYERGTRQQTFGGIQ